METLQEKPTKPVTVCCAKCGSQRLAGECDVRTIHSSMSSRPAHFCHDKGCAARFFLLRPAQETRMVSRLEGMMLIAIFCLACRLQPEDLERVATPLAEFDAVNDAITGELNNVACD